MQLGLPGIGFRTEKRRFYPGGATASHIVGLTNIDNQGIAGIEKYIDDQGLADLQASGLAVAKDLKPVKLSIDLRVQHIVRDELAKAMERYHAIAAGAVVLNVKTGEVVAMASVPDFDPNNPYNAHDKDRLNRMSAGTLRDGLDLQELHHGDGARFRQGHAEEPVRCVDGRSRSAASDDPAISTARAGC